MMMMVGKYLGTYDLGQCILSKKSPEEKGLFVEKYFTLYSPAAACIKWVLGRYL